MRAATRISWLQGAPPSPAIARTHMPRCAGGGQPPTAQRMRLPSSRTQLQPCLTSCTQHKVRRVVWRTHSGSPLVARGGEAVPGADGTRFLRSDRTGGVSPRGPPAHTQPHNCTWPTLRRTPPSQETCTPPGRARRPPWACAARFCTGVAHTHGRTPPHTQRCARDTPTRVRL